MNSNVPVRFGAGLGVASFAEALAEAIGTARSRSIRKAVYSSASGVWARTILLMLISRWRMPALVSSSRWPRIASRRQRSSWWPEMKGMSDHCAALENYTSVKTVGYFSARCTASTGGNVLVAALGVWHHWGFGGDSFRGIDVGGGCDGG
jgi:hypothetical protein